MTTKRSSGSFVTDVIAPIGTGLVVAVLLMKLVEMPWRVAFRYVGGASCVVAVTWLTISRYRRHGQIPPASPSRPQSR